MLYALLCEKDELGVLENSAMVEKKIVIAIHLQEGVSHGFYGLEPALFWWSKPLYAKMASEFIVVRQTCCDARKLVNWS